MNRCPPKSARHHLAKDHELFEISLLASALESVPAQAVFDAPVNCGNVHCALVSAVLGCDIMWLYCKCLQTVGRLKVV